jgi:hypothetical protein
LGRHQPDGAHRMREIAHNWISPVRIKVNASQIAVATAGAAQSEDRSAKQKTTFFDSIDPKETSAATGRRLRTAMSRPRFFGEIGRIKTGQFEKRHVEIKRDNDGEG